jgi:tetratricopeptide (TPR) repeat protein
MTTQSEETVELNNRGVAYLERGNFGKAFTLFRDALRNTMANLRETTATGQGAASPTSRKTSQDVWKTKGMEAFAASKSMRRLSSYGAVNSHYVFSEGITLMEENDAYSPNELVNVSVASSIVLLNLGLIHHLKGLKENSSKYLIKAESFYQKSFALLSETGLLLGRSGHPVIDYVALALLNNAAQVGRELAHTEQSKQNFTELLAVALQINAASYGDSSVVAKFLDETKMACLLNAMCLSEQTLAAAA